MRWFKRTKPTPVGEQMSSILVQMEHEGPNSPRYAELMTLLERLHKLEADKARKPVSSDTIALVFGNLAGILLIVAYEQKHVLTSKGMMQILKPNQPKTPQL